MNSKYLLRARAKVLRSNYFLLLCIVFLLFCLSVNHYFRRNDSYFEQYQSDNNVHSIIDRIRDIPILDQNYLFNITYEISINNLPSWISRFNMTYLFNFYWLQNGAYLWHLQRLMDYALSSKNISLTSTRFLSYDLNQTELIDLIHQHPDRGIFLDTSSDPVPLLFPPLPQTSSSLIETCQHYSWLQQWYPCFSRSEQLPNKPFQSLVTYALYDVAIDLCLQSSRPPTIFHYNELLYLFNSDEYFHNETRFIRHVLPRLVRLLAFVPKTASLLLPRMNSSRYFRSYLDLLIERGLIADHSRFIEWNCSRIYHSNVLYSTSTPRSDLILLNRVLLGDTTQLRRELIVILSDKIDSSSYQDIIQTINQFEYPEDFKYLHIYEYKDLDLPFKNLSEIFRQARIVIGASTNLLSHLVWCLPGTHIIEILHPQRLTTDYYEMSLELKLNYWITVATDKNQVDMIDFRNLMLKVLTNIDN